MYFSKCKMYFWWLEIDFLECKMNFWRMKMEFYNSRFNIKFSTVRSAARGTMPQSHGWLWFAEMLDLDGVSPVPHQQHRLVWKHHCIASVQWCLDRFVAMNSRFQLWNCWWSCPQIRNCSEMPFLFSFSEEQIKVEENRSFNFPNVPFSIFKNSFCILKNSFPIIKNTFCIFKNSFPIIKNKYCNYSKW